MRLSSYLPVVFAMAVAAGLSLLAATFAVDHIEKNARSEMSGAMLAEGHQWVDVSVDGLQVVLRGTAPDEATRFRAIAAAGKVVDATRIVSRLEVLPGQQINAPDYSVEILRNLDGISLIGLIPADYEEVIDRIERISDLPVADLLEVGEYEVPDSWDEAMDLAVTALGESPRSKISVTESSVSITAMVASTEEKRELEGLLRREAPRGIILDLDIAAPRPVIAPFTTRVRMDEGNLRFDACAAETEAARNRILTKAREAGATGSLICEIGLGAPSLDWDNAVNAGIDAIVRLGAGTVTLANTDISLVAPYSVESSVFDRAVGELEHALPEGYSLTALKTPRPATETQSEGADAVEETPEFVATLSSEGQADLQGRLPDERARDVVESYAKAHFGADKTEQAARLDPNLPEGWWLRVLAGLDALSHLNNGSVIVRPDVILVSGKTGRETAAADISGLFAERLADGALYEIDVAYEERLDPLAGLPTPEQCVDQLNTVLAVQKITFEPGSAEIDSDGFAVVEQLVELLKTCQHVQMEIGGHTDSQGREVMNERLSAERANAVLAAIMDQRILTANLSAKGYGETTPIADNDTEEGREANRRIEFTLLVPEDETETAEAAVDGEQEVQEEAQPEEESTE